MKRAVIFGSFAVLIGAAVIVDRMDRHAVPNIGWTVELIPADEAAAYYDGRKLVNDNQRNWVDMLAEQARVSK